MFEELEIAEEEFDIGEIEEMLKEEVPEEEG